MNSKAQHNAHIQLVAQLSQHPVLADIASVKQARTHRVASGLAGFVHYLLHVSNALPKNSC